MTQVAGQPVSDNTIQRITHEVGIELAARRDADPKSDESLAQRPAEPPAIAVIMCDGGRIRTREPGWHGVHLSNTGWNETKVAGFFRATGQAHDTDPQPEPPACFADRERIAHIAATKTGEAATPTPTARDPTPDEAFDLHPPDRDAVECDTPDDRAAWRPQRLFRTVLASMADSTTFGEQMSREAKRRRFRGAPSRAFLGDGQAWNWTIWKRHFASYTPILDFVHVLSYLFVAAKAARPAAEAWDQYLVWMRACWQSGVANVLAELRAIHAELSANDATVTDATAERRRELGQVIGYLTNQQSRMNYAEYRRAGLPVTTAWMESLVKEINYRVKGTEMFWNNPEGAEAILQVRAAALSEDDRLLRHLTTRPGCAFTRRPKAPKPPAQTCKS